MFLVPRRLLGETVSLLYIPHCGVGEYGGNRMGWFIPCGISFTDCLFALSHNFIVCEMGTM